MRPTRHQSWLPSDPGSFHIWADSSPCGTEAGDLSKGVSRLSVKPHGAGRWWRVERMTTSEAQSGAQTLPRSELLTHPQRSLLPHQERTCHSSVTSTEAACRWQPLKLCPPVTLWGFIMKSPELTAHPQGEQPSCLQYPPWAGVFPTTSGGRGGAVLGGRLWLTDAALTQVPLWFCPSPHRQDQPALKWTLPSASPLSALGLWNRTGCVETCPWLVAGCGKASERTGLIITIQVKTLPCV